MQVSILSMGFKGLNWLFPLISNSSFKFVFYFQVCLLFSSLSFLPQTSSFSSPWKRKGSADQPTGSPQSPFLISDDSDSDATHIFSQPSQNSQHSEGSEFKVISLSPENSQESAGSVTPNKGHTKGRLNRRVRGEKGHSKETDMKCSQGSFASSGSSVIEID